jgi:hypothetical protein
MAPIAMAVGAGLQVAAGIQEGDTANAVGMYNEKVANQQTQEIRAKTLFDQTRQAEEGSRVMSSMVAGGAAAGGGMNLLALAKQRSELELQNLMIGREGTIAAAQAKAGGAMARWQGRVAQKQAYMKAGGTALQGFGSAMSAGATSTDTGAMTKTMSTSSMGG